MDPGDVRTGFASAEMGLNRLERVESNVAPPMEFAHWLAEKQRVEDGRQHAGCCGTFAVIVFETWRLRADKAMQMVGSEFPTPQLIGMIRLIAHLTNTRLVPSSPANKSVADGSMPEWFARYDADSSEQHDQDARKHLWLYYFNEWFDPTQEPA